MPIERIVAQHTAPPPSTRSLAYPEALRCLFCVLVVAGHSDLAYISTAMSGVAGFFAISLGFAAPTADPAKLRARALHLLGLWAIWSVVYALLAIAKSMMRQQAPFEWLHPSMLFTGTSIHLWFLSALAAAFLAMSVVPVRLRTRGMGLALIACSAVSWIGFSGASDLLRAPGFAQAHFTLIVALSATGLALALPRALPRWTAIPALLALIAGFAGLFLGVPPMPCHVATAAASLALCRVAQPATPHAVTRAAELTPGIYLVHAAALSALALAGLKGLPAAPVALVASAAVVAAGRRTPLRGLFG